MPKETILIVDDEQDILELLDYNLKRQGYTVIKTMTGEKAIDIAEKNNPNLIVLDLMLPGIDGLEVTRYLKGNENTCDIPIVMLTAKGDESDVVIGLELGANDYISKPFSPKELIARIRGILRRQKKPQNTLHEKMISQYGNMTIDRQKHVVTIKGKAIDLTYLEFALLAFLAHRKGWVFTRGQIVDAIHGDDHAVTQRSIDVIIVGLRKKLMDYSSIIETVRGVGYRFKE